VNRPEPAAARAQVEDVGLEGGEDQDGQAGEDGRDRDFPEITLSQEDRGAFLYEDEPRGPTNN
jgi:hypothetical protein